jgi:WD40 repeat protein
VPVWDVATGSKLCELETPVGELMHAAVTPDRTKLATVMVTRTENKSEYHIVGWELTSGKKLGTLTEPGGFGSTYQVAAPDNSSVLASTPEGKLLLVNLADGKAVKTFETNRRNLTAPPVFAPDGKQVAIASSIGFGPMAAGEIKILDVNSGKITSGFQGHGGVISSLAYSPDGKVLASGGFDTTVLLWDVAAATPDK